MAASGGSIPGPRPSEGRRVKAIALPFALGARPGLSRPASLRPNRECVLQRLAAHTPQPGRGALRSRGLKCTLRPLSTWWTPLPLRATHTLFLRPRRQDSARCSARFEPVAPAHTHGGGRASCSLGRPCSLTLLQHRGAPLATPTARTRCGWFGFFLIHHPDLRSDEITR